MLPEKDTPNANRPRFIGYVTEPLVNHNVSD